MLCKNKNCKKGNFNKRVKLEKGSKLFCSDECMSEWIDCNKVKFERKAQIARNKERKAEKETIINYEEKLQKKVQHIARLIDDGNPCLARNIYGGQKHGGHVLSKGGNANMKFNLHNIFIQGAQSNHFQSDDVLMREGVVRVFSQSYMDFITSLKQTPTQSQSNEYYKEKYQIGCKIANDLKKGEVTNRTPENRQLLRNQFNLELGIYEAKYCVFDLSYLESL